jgi:hypothetical protein
VERRVVSRVLKVKVADVRDGPLDQVRERAIDQVQVAGKLGNGLSFFQHQRDRVRAIGTPPARRW